MTKHGDTAGFFNDMEEARAYVAGSRITSENYHSDRIRALRHLLARIPQPKSVLDFGCGDCMCVRDLCSPERVVGVDVSAPMIELARENLGPIFTGHVGGVEKLKTIDDRFDIAFAIDVLGYLSESDLETFYREISRLLRPGGHLIVMYGNELFDLYALNAGTAEFFRKHFELDASGLLTEGKASQYKTVDRRNPLSFGAEIARFGLREISQAFSQWHRVPPAIGNKGKDDLSAARLAMRDHAFDPNGLAPAEQWKALFRSSIFASLSQRA
ncbi:MAG: class I SAM-dependent methyltransferase [Bradyrhizobium sp.]|nr:class I SAM-dependent methyltransferase [Bradyrhizobium sp.]